MKLLIIPIGIAAGIGFAWSWGASAAFVGGFCVGAFYLAFGAEASLRNTLRHSGLVAIERNGQREFVSARGMTAKAFMQDK